MIKYPRYIVFLLTTTCNLRCSYCYRDNRDPFPENFHKNSRPMSKSIIEKVLLFAGKSGKNFHVQLAGGEPTFEPELIEWTGEIIKKHNLPASLGIQTNGTLIDTSLIQIFKQYNIQVGISLDGTPEIQEKLRGKSDLTFKGLKLLSEFRVPFQITCVVTEHNADNLDQLALILGSFDSVKGIGLDLLVCKGRAIKGNYVYPCSPENLKNGIRKLIQALDWVNRNRIDPIRLRELENLKHSYKRQKSGAFCYAMTGEAMAIHPNGMVYPCAQLIGNPVFELGTIDDIENWPFHDKKEDFGTQLLKKNNTFYAINKMINNKQEFQIQKNISIYQQYRPEDILNSCTLENKNCEDCPVYGFCPGDCPSRIFYNNDDTMHLACIMYQSIWEEYKKTQINI